MENKKGRKSNEIDYEARMPRVYEMMLYEHLGYDEFASKAAKEFEITTRAAESLWTEARPKWTLCCSYTTLYPISISQ